MIFKIVLLFLVFMGAWHVRQTALDRRQTAAIANAVMRAQSASAKGPVLAEGALWKMMPWLLSGLGLLILLLAGDALVKGAVNLSLAAWCACVDRQPDDCGFWHLRA